MSYAEKIHKLNDSIKRINDTRADMLAEQRYLQQECIDKLSKLGQGTALEAFKAGDTAKALELIKQALKVETSKLDKKVALTEKLVALFDNGDYQGMDNLLGLGTAEKSITEEYKESKAQAVEGVEEPQEPEETGGVLEETEEAPKVEPATSAQVEEATPAVADTEPSTAGSSEDFSGGSGEESSIQALEDMGIDMSVDEQAIQGTASDKEEGSSSFEFDFDF